MTLQVEKFCT